MSYVLGRTLLENRVRSYLFSSQRKNDDTDNENGNILGIMVNSIAKKPFLSSLIMKFSIFPEIIKNLTLSVIENVKWYIFMAVSFLHFLPYTVLWTSVGYDSALRLRDTDIPPNYILNGFFLFSVVFGYAISPPLFALWVRHQVKQSNK